MRPYRATSRCTTTDALQLDTPVRSYKGLLVSPHEEIGKRQRGNGIFPRRAEMKVRKNEMKLRKNEIEVPKNFLRPPWRVSFSSVGDFDFLRAVGSWIAGRAQMP